MARVSGALAPLATVVASAVFAAVATLWIERRRAARIRRAPGFKPHRMSRYAIHNGRLESQGLTADPTKDIAGQTAECLAKLQAILDEVGAPRGQLLSMWIFLADLADFAAMNTVYDAWVADCDKPTRLCVEAGALDTGCKIEIRASAAMPGPDAWWRWW